MIKLRPAHLKDLTAIVDLLNSSDLPTNDLTAERLVGFIAAEHTQQLIGVAGIEPMGSAGLIRSLAVAPAHRGSGLGQQLVARCEASARNAGIEALYLLTTTADAYLRRLGYADIPRNKVPDGIANHPQFKGLCPATAKCLMKSLETQ